MCFSTTASFVAGSLLTAIGVASIKKAHAPSQYMFACIPLVFAIQQFSEGFVWISLLNSGNFQLQQASTNFFLIVALLIWPTWIPLSVFLIEEKRKRKLILGVVSLFGIVFSALSIYFFLVYNSSSRITPYHIHYDLAIPEKTKTIFGILYLIPTVIAHFVSSNKKINIMGGLVLASYLISILVFNDTVLSVWCFFSAIISSMIYYILANNDSVIITKPIYFSIKSNS
ncbi:MAG: hypothetical protein Q7W45_09630 [Bacteroidota bacterium]|nr:hypothetical protein [Bacteroidota bacterium]MDP3144060.1 hypothetical protein [Bacteroidota bacterium]